MRDLSRIPQVLDCIARVWAKRPELPLMQLIEAAASDGVAVLDFEDPLTLEDDALVQRLEAFDRPVREA